MNLDENTIRAILATNENDPQAQQLARQQKMADSMRSQGMQQAQPLQAGRRVLPNYGGILTNMMTGIMGQKQQVGIDKGMKEVNDRQTGARKQYLDALMASLRRDLPQAAPQSNIPEQSMGQPPTAY